MTDGESFSCRKVKSMFNPQRVINFICFRDEIFLVRVANFFLHVFILELALFSR